ncbi:unnamed protein product [Clonostachys rosea]|uniref:Cytochrome P450 n=1 Tax=Bionectria ochroleuca TaxID=29856 RepID=A0ABY6TYU7_BIOOC|nr:unnamed protein product [Clonostachys rosea]
MQTSLSSAVLGVLAHILVFRNVELDNFLLGCLTIAVTSYMSLLAFFLVHGTPILATFWEVGVILASFSVGVFFSILIYRAFFHRLRNIPGPFGARLSKLYAAYLSSKEVKYHEELGKLQMEYGDFIRTGPREICIVRKSAVRLMHGPDSVCRKTTWYSQVTTDPMKTSVHTTRDHEVHRRRRKAWERGVAIKVLPSYEPRISELVEIFVDQISQGSPVNATDWSMFLAFDIMGKVGFGKDFDCLVEGRKHPAIGGMDESMETISTIGQIPWLLYYLSRIPGATAGYTGFFKMCSDEIEKKFDRWQPDQAPNDIMSWLLKAFMEKDPSAPPSKEAFNEDSRVMIVGGSGTTATTLTTTLFYLIKNPAILHKARTQVDFALPNSEDWTYENVKKITYIDDIINEALRLKPPVLVGGPRVTPANGLQVDKKFIPGDVNVIVPIQLLQTDPRYWKRSKEFIPERFGEKREEFGTSDAPFFPFQLGKNLSLHSNEKDPSPSYDTDWPTGAYSCPGKNLTYMSLRMALSRILQELEFKFAPGEDGTRFDTEWKETFGATPPDLFIEFSRRVQD